MSGRRKEVSDDGGPEPGEVAAPHVGRGSQLYLNAPGPEGPGQPKRATGPSGAPFRVSDLGDAVPFRG
jgi:hypothetical protein